jgi:hypothetical protein
MADEHAMFRTVHRAIKGLKPDGIVMELHGDATSCRIVACWGIEEFIYAEDSPSRLYDVFVANMDGIRAWLERIAGDPTFRARIAASQATRRAATTTDA